MEQLDPEIQAMATVAAALDGLADAEGRSRVLRWAADKYGVTPISSTQPVSVVDAGTKTGSTPATEFSDFVDLFDAVDPADNLEKALTGAYWFQVVKGGASWQSQQVNSVLKDTGNGISDILDTLNIAKSKKPALVRQMAKNGTSRQARKTYKLTTAGISLVVAKLSAANAISGTGE